MRLKEVDYLWFHPDAPASVLLKRTIVEVTSDANVELLSLEHAVLYCKSGAKASGPRTGCRLAIFGLIWYHGGEALLEVMNARFDPLGTTPEPW